MPADDQLGHQQADGAREGAVVRVVHSDERMAAVREPPVQRGGLAGPTFREGHVDQEDPRILRGQATADLASVVGAGVVHHDDLEPIPRVVGGQQDAQRSFDHSGLVVSRDDH